MGSESSVRVRCKLLTDFTPHELSPPSSCGLDFWQSPDALDWVGSFLNARPAVIRVTTGSEQASLCCLLRRLPFGVYLASAYPYGMISGDVGLFWQSSAAITRVLRKNRVVRVEIPFTGEYIEQLPRQKSDLGSTVLLERPDAIRHVIDLRPAQQDPEWFMRRLAPNTRWAIRKAGRIGCTVRLASENELEAVQAIYVATMQAKGAPVNYGKERFRGMIGRLSGKDHAKVYLGVLEGRPVGVAAVVDGTVSRHFIQLAVLPEVQASRLSELLVNTVIIEALKAGRQYFDFMASPVSDAGLIAFKAKWGTIEEPIRHAIIVGMPGLHRVVDLARWANRTRARFSGA